MKQVLLVDDDAAVRDAVSQTLELADFDVIRAGSFVEAKDHIKSSFAGVILSDIRMPGRDGFYLLEFARGVDPDLPVVFLSGEGDIPMAVKAVATGAFDFLEKPCGANDMIAVLERAQKTRQLVLENRRLKHSLETGDPASRMIFGQSRAANDLRFEIRAAARLSTDVLITGALGTGISKVAEVLHLSSLSSKGPFQKRAADHLNRDDLSQVIDECRGGTLFLEGIETLSRDSQLWLLDEMERGTDCPRIVGGFVGSVEDLETSGQLTPDLFYRLNTIVLRIPPLSERPEDIPVMFRHYVAQAAEQSGRPMPEIRADVLAHLMAQEWSGNARALMSVAMKFVLGLDPTMANSSDGQLGLVNQMAQVEKSILLDVLKKTQGRPAEAIKILKLPRKTFYDKLAKHGLRTEMFR